MISVDTTSITVVDADCSGDEVVSLPAATADDDCDGTMAVVDDAPATFPANQTTTVTFTATDDCGNTADESVDATVKYGATIEVHANTLTFGWGHHPTITKGPLAGITVHAYARPGSEFCSHHQSWWAGWHWWRHVAHDCNESEPVNSAVTDANGIALIDVPPGDYIVITFFDFDGDEVVDHYLGRPAPNVDCGETLKRRLRLIITPRGKQLAAKICRFDGSELLVAEPDMMVWDEEEQEYPFGLESEGDWGVSVEVTTPEGFVPDEPALSTEVNDEIEALQFTVTEVGSDLIPTRTKFTVTHNGRREIHDSNVGIILTPDYARSRGFDVPTLRAKGLIFEPKAKRTETRGTGGTDGTDPTRRR